MTPRDHGRLSPTLAHARQARGLTALLVLSYMAQCEPDGEGGTICTWNLFDSRSAHDSGKIYVQQHLTRTGQLVSPCIHAAF